MALPNILDGDTLSVICKRMGLPMKGDALMDSMAENTPRLADRFPLSELLPAQLAATSIYSLEELTRMSAAIVHLKLWKP